MYTFIRVLLAIFLVESSVAFLRLPSKYASIVATRTSFKQNLQSQKLLLSTSNARVPGIEMAAIVTGNDDKEKRPDKNNLSKIVGGVVIAAILLLLVKYGTTVDFNALIESSVTKISAMGPYGYLYFAGIYILAEVFAVPAMPLTASSGYLFGLFPGYLTVLVSATIAAAISFKIGRTFLRDWAQGIASTSPKWRAIDSAVSKEGFKVVLLLRLSPLLPFAISNYLYGLTSVDFFSFITATFLGFAPGTFGLVYAGKCSCSIILHAVNLLSQ